MWRGPNVPGCDIQCKVLCPLLEETMVTCYCRVRVSSWVHTLRAWVSPEARPAAPTVPLNCMKDGLNPGVCGMNSTKTLSPGKKHAEELFGFGKISFPHPAPKHHRAAWTGSQPAQKCPCPVGTTWAPSAQPIPTAQSSFSAGRSKASNLPCIPMGWQPATQPPATKD